MRATEVAVAYTRAGEVDYVYQVDVLLAREDNVPQLRDVLPRLRRDHARPQPATETSCCCRSAATATTTTMAT